ncbi:hypothetical protein EBPHNEJP_00103 [Salmonella phage CF-SP2]|nr:hypothetical protein EBPHNEJP_00103 [Salmonella phage CF-SP2]
MHIFVLILALTTVGDGGVALEKVEIKSQDYSEANQMCKKAGEMYKLNVNKSNSYPTYSCLYAGIK